MIKKFFVKASEAKIVKKMEDLNPYMVRYLKCVQTVEASQLHLKFKGELIKYLEFLLRFSNKNEAFRKSSAYI